MYIAAYLDRTNVSLAALQMNQDLGLSTAVYGLGSGIFFVGYALFEVPSNLILARVGARRWIARIAITWGMLACAMMFVRGPRSFYAIRFLLGFAEAGFFPGIVYYLGALVPAAPARARDRRLHGRRATVVGDRRTAGRLAALAHRTSRPRRMAMAVLVEGVPSVLLGVVVLFYLTDRPEDASWLTRRAARLARARDWRDERLARARRAKRTSCARCGSGALWRLAAVYLFGVSTWLGTMYFAPVLIRDTLGIGTTGVGLVIGALGLVGLAGMLSNGAHSDATGERVVHTAAPLLVVSVGLRHRRARADARPRSSWVSR